MDYSTPAFPIHHYLLEFAQTHVHWVGDAIQPTHPLCPLLLLLLIFPSIRVFSNELALCKVAKVLELQLQHQSFQWIFIGSKSWIAIISKFIFDDGRVISKCANKHFGSRYSMKMVLLTDRFKVVPYQTESSFFSLRSVAEPIVS